METEEIFNEIGFEKQETKIYMYLLKKGASTQQEISDKLQIIRQTVYDNMKKMLNKGYISLSIEGKKKLYSSVSPEIILNKIKERQEEFEAIIPNLKKITKEKSEVYSETFIGLKGLQNLINMTLTSKTGILWAANQKSSEFIFKDPYWDNYAIKRIENKIPVKLLFESSYKKGKKLYKTNKRLFRETKTNTLIEKTDSTLILFEDKIIFYTTKEENLFGVFIKNKEIKEFLEKMFIKIWNLSSNL